MIILRILCFFNIPFAPPVSVPETASLFIDEYKNTFYMYLFQFPKIHSLFTRPKVFYRVV